MSILLLRPIRHETSWNIILTSATWLEIRSSFTTFDSRQILINELYTGRGCAHACVSILSISRTLRARFAYAWQYYPSTGRKGGKLRGVSATLARMGRHPMVCTLLSTPTFLRTRCARPDLQRRSTSPIEEDQSPEKGDANTPWSLLFSQPTHQSLDVIRASTRSLSFPHPLLTISINAIRSGEGDHSRSHHWFKQLASWPVGHRWSAPRGCCTLLHRTLYIVTVSKRACPSGYRMRSLPFEIDFHVVHKLAGHNAYARTHKRALSRCFTILF